MYEISRDNANFLDLNVSIKDSNLVTDLHFRVIYPHRYLHHQSSLKDHIKSQKYIAGSSFLKKL